MLNATVAGLDLKLRKERDIATATKSIQMVNMREGSVLARSGSFGSFLRLLANRLRTTLILMVNVRPLGAEEQRGDEDEFAWREAYKAALLEFNERRASLAINEAMRAIERRKRMLRFTSKNDHEWEMLEQATATLLTIRTHRVLPSPDNTQDATANDAHRAW